MKKLLILIAFAATINLAIAQPEENDGGLLLNVVIIKNQLFMFEGEGWVNKSKMNDPSAKKLIVKHILLDEKFEQNKKELPRINPAEYNLMQQPNYAYGLFLPPYIKNKPTPNQRTIFYYDNDSMIIDFLNIPEKSFMPTRQLSLIYFKPGKYIFTFRPKAALTPGDKNEAAWLNLYMNQGITPDAEPYLLKYGVLFYTPPANLEATWKYVNPQIIVEQPTAYYVNIKLNGYFLGQIKSENAQGNGINPYYKIEVLKNGLWEEKPMGIGIAFNNDSNLIVPTFYENMLFLKLSSYEQSSSANLEPGTYRISFVTDDKVIINSTIFSLGMLPADKNNPYQKLYRESTGFPYYRLDKSDNIYITTPFNPVYPDPNNTNVKTYHFEYFWGISDNMANDSPHPENDYTKHFITLVSTKKMTINGTPYSGKIKFGFNYSRFHVNSRQLSTNIYVIDYVNGNPIKVEILKDVDLINESTPIRDTDY